MNDYIIVRYKPKVILKGNTITKCMSQRDKQAYDRGVSVFSPEGRIYQVEYAREAVQNGSPTVGFQSEHGVVLAAIVPDNSSLKVTDSVRKIHKIEDSVCVGTTGYVGDGRRLVDDLRVSTQQNQLRYDEDPTISAVSKQIADHIHEVTQTGGHRPYGSSLIIGGIDGDGTSLYEVEPGGTPSEWLAVANGRDRNDYQRFFEDEYSEDYTVEELVSLAIEAFQEISSEEITETSVDVASVDTESEQYYTYDKSDLAEFL